MRSTKTARGPQKSKDSNIYLIVGGGLNHRSDHTKGDDREGRLMMTSVWDVSLSLRALCEGDAESRPILGLL